MAQSLVRRKVVGKSHHYVDPNTGAVTDAPPGSIIDVTPFQAEQFKNRLVPIVTSVAVPDEDVEPFIAKATGEDLDDEDEDEDEDEATE